MSIYLIHEVGPVQIHRTGLKKEAMINRSRRNALRDVLKRATHAIIDYLHKKGQQYMTFTKQEIINILQQAKIVLDREYMPILLSNVEIGYNSSNTDMKCVRYGAIQLDIVPKSKKFL